MSREQLLALVGEQAKQIAALTAMNEELATRLARVEHLLSRNSGNSSLPPSMDDDPGRTPPAAKRRRGGPKRPQGKQPGAAGANLAWVERPDDLQDRFPQGRCECGHDLAEAADLGVADRYQQHEIPQVSVKVTQYDQHAVRCGCGAVHTAARPEGARTGPVGYGPNLQAFAVYLMVAQHIPVGRCVQLLESLTGATPSVGFVHGMLARAAGLLAEVDRRIRALITLAYAVCADETPLRVGPRTPRPGRKKAELGALTHQLCCQHLCRDLDGAGEVYPDQVWPTQIAQALRALMHQANLARDAGREAIDDAIKNKLITLFKNGVRVGLSDTTSHSDRPGERKARLLLEVLRDREADVLRFARDLKVPATGTVPSSSPGACSRWHIPEPSPPAMSHGAGTISPRCCCSPIPSSPTSCASKPRPRSPASRPSSAIAWRALCSSGCRPGARTTRSPPASTCTRRPSATGSTSCADSSATSSPIRTPG